MRAPQYKQNGRFGFNMTPMIDVVFLLIIFFLVSSHLARQENNIELKLPVASTGEEDIDSETPRLTINVKPDGTLLLAGRPIESSLLPKKLQTAAEENEGNIEVRIRGSRSAAYSNVEPVMLACTKAGIWKVSYAVYREESQ